MSEQLKVLLVDDEAFNLDLLQQSLESSGFEAIPVSDGKSALAKLTYGFPGILVTDVKMPGMDGLELTRRVREIDAEIPVILISAYGEIDMAVQAIQDGAYDFIEKPVDMDRLRRKSRRAIRDRAQVLENRALRAELLAQSGIEATILGNSVSMVELRKDIANVADVDAAVMIRGETGTGKELVARALHDLSQRREGNFVAINCSAIPKDLFESELFGHEKGAFTNADRRRIGQIEHAHEGTLFLDEIESMPLEMQAKLLRVLQESEIVRLGANDPISVDFRVVAATQGKLAQAIEEGRFREDLFFRLNVAELHLPPLADRREDIPLLFEAFLQELANRHGREVPLPAAEDLQALMAHDWPGNVRELRNIAERHVLGLSRQTEATSPVEPASLAQQVEAFEKYVIEQELARNNGNVKDTATALDIPVRTLNDRMRKHELRRSDFKKQ